MNPSNNQQAVTTASESTSSSPRSVSPVAALSTAVLPSSLLGNGTAFYAKIPACWDALTQEERNSAVGWLEVYGEEPQEHVLKDGVKFTVGTSQQCDYQLDVADMPQVCFAVSADHTTVSCTNMGLPILMVNDHKVVQNEVDQDTDKCFIKIPGCKTTFTVYSLKLATIVPEELSSEYIENVHRRYKITNDFLGKGGFGAVRLALDRNTGQRVAVKIVARRNNEESIINEINALRSIKCDPHFVMYLDERYTAHNVYIVLPYMAGGDLARYVRRHGPLPEMEVKHIFKQLFEGVLILHSLNIAHGDIKPHNILLVADSECPKVVYTDFGLARFIRPSMPYSSGGTMAYKAPEVMLASTMRQNLLSIALGDENQEFRDQLNSSTVNGYGTPIDMWSLGITLYKLLTGNYPYDTQHGAFGYLKDVLNTPLGFEQGNHLSDEAIDLITRLLTIDSSTRCTAEDALACHWFDEEEEQVDAAAPLNVVSLNEEEPEASTTTSPPPTTPITTPSPPTQAASGPTTKKQRLASKLLQRRRLKRRCYSKYKSQGAAKRPRDDSTNGLRQAKHITDLAAYGHRSYRAQLLRTYSSNSTGSAVGIVIKRVFDGSTVVHPPLSLQLYVYGTHYNECLCGLQ
ncbi:kinase-like domain-containing protein [Syncephalis fuscata]|nr:kinase-like domain-containing protein [Syncephalis fuscata]